MTFLNVGLLCDIISVPRWESLGREDPLEKEMATHSSILAWGIPRAEEPGGLQSMGLQRVRHNRVAEHTHCDVIGDV